MSLPKNIKRIDEVTWEIPTSYKKGMNVPARIIASEKLFKNLDSEVFNQITDVATLPGIQKYALCHADGHRGYGAPIGAAAAFDMKEGVISPGMVGFDVNCGMRLLKTNLTLKDVQPKIKNLVNTLFKLVPAGVGCKGFVNLTPSKFEDVMQSGAKWCIENGYGWKKDLESIEDYGTLKGADPKKISQKAKSRGLNQLGTLGSGNHYLEIQIANAENIFDEKSAKKLGIVEKDQILIMVHCGSRGFGHQIATDYMKLFDKTMKDHNIKIPDKELSCAPFQSQEGQDYYSAMKCAGNMAYANRQVILHQIRTAFKDIFKQDPEKLGMDLIYDCTHNIAREHKITVNGKKKKVLVHLKGATTSLGPGHERLIKKYRTMGSPIIIGGSMETGSYLLKGTKKAEETTFGTTCFTGETKIITDKGLIALSDIHKKFLSGENFMVPSLNENTLEIEWKSILDTMKKRAKVSEVSISQKGDITQNRLKTTKDHKFITLKDGNLIHKKVEDIINSQEGVILLDGLKAPLESDITNEMAYVVGGIMADGSFRSNERRGSVTFTQKKIPEKVKFIEHMSHCFRETFSQELLEKGTKYGGGIIGGKQIYGYATDFICNSQMIAEKMKTIYRNLDSWVLSLGQKATSNFLAGLIDGDGTWNKRRKTLQIFNGDDKITGAIVLACLKLGTLPQISKQRGTCYIIQIDEIENRLFHYTKRVRHVPRRRRKYGNKLYVTKQLFENIENIKWPFSHKAKNNNLMSDKIIAQHIHKYPKHEEKIRKLIDSNLRMQRIRHVQDLNEKEVYNITIEGNHNYFVMTNIMTPILVRNCHGAGRIMSRTKAKQLVNGERLQKDMEKRGIYVKGVSTPSLAEEAGAAYKDIIEVIDSITKAGISSPIIRLKPLGNVKG